MTPSGGMVSALIFCVIPAVVGLHPVILLPGDGGSQVEARLNKTNTVHYICEKHSDWFTLWLNLEQLIPEVVDCWVDNVKLRYDNQTHQTLNNEGVETRIPGFGNTSTVEWLDPSQRLVSLYFNTIANHLTNVGYTRGTDLHGAPYDFRKAANEAGVFFSNLKNLIQSTYTDNEDSGVVLLCHSMGSPMALYFLNSMTSAWKAKYVRALLTLAGPWGGTVRALKVFAVGDNLGAWILSEKKLMWEQRTFPSLAWLMPQEDFWEEDEVLVETFERNYTRLDYQDFFTDLSEPNGWLMREDTKGLNAGLPAPGVEVFCLHGTGVDSTQKLVYGEGQFPDWDPDIIYGNGDGTVNIGSLMGCTRWRDKQTQMVHHHIFPGVDHMQVIRENGPAEFVANIVDNLNKQLEQARARGNTNNANTASVNVTRQDNLHVNGAELETDLENTNNMNNASINVTGQDNHRVNGTDIDTDLDNNISTQLPVIEVV